MISAIYPIPAFADNYIWALLDSASDGACVVDPGDAGPVLEYLQTNKRQLTVILITHHHADHTGGLTRLTEAYQPVVYGPPGIDGITKVLKEGDEIEVFDTRFRVLAVPGHTLDHIAYYSDNTAAEQSETAPPTGSLRSPAALSHQQAALSHQQRVPQEGSDTHAKDQNEPLLFCGDTLFAAGCGRLFEGTPEMMFDSLGKLSALPPHTRVYCTHEYTLANLKFAAAADAQAEDQGKSRNQALQARIGRETAQRAASRPTLPSTIGLELATNPFLRCDTVKEFAALRKWKDEF